MMYLGQGNEVGGFFYHDFSVLSCNVSLVKDCCFLYLRVELDEDFPGRGKHYCVPCR